MVGSKNMWILLDPILRTSNFGFLVFIFLNPRGSNVQQAISDGSEKIYVRNEILFTLSKFYLYCLDPFVTWVCLKIPKCVKTSAECRLDGCNICFKGEANLKLYALVTEPRCYYIPSEFENVF